MNTLPELLAEFQDEDFATIGPFPHQTQMSIMPVVAMKGQYLRGVGTCFAISSQGLVITARHVIEDALEIDDNGEKKDPDLWVGAVYAAELGLEDLGEVPDLLGGPLPAHKVHYSESHDIALMQLNLPRRRETGGTLRMPQLKLGMRIPSEGEPCVGIGYHAMDWKQATGPHTHDVAQSYSASQGRIGTVHLIKRDDVLMKFPCFQTDCRLVGGMSGGPVIDGANGTVIGIVCAGFEVPEGEKQISYASLARTSLSLVLEATTASGRTEKKFLYDFVQGGAVITDDEFTVVSDWKVGDQRTLTIDFNGVHVTNRLIA